MSTTVLPGGCSGDLIHQNNSELIVRVHGFDGPMDDKSHSREGRTLFFVRSSFGTTTLISWKFEKKKAPRLTQRPLFGTAKGRRLQFTCSWHLWRMSLQMARALSNEPQATNLRVNDDDHNHD